MRRWLRRDAEGSAARGYGTAHRTLLPALTAHCHPLRFQGPGHSQTKPKALQEQEVLRDLLIEVKWVMKVAGVRSRAMNG